MSVQLDCCRASYSHCVVYSYTCAVTGFPLTMFLPTPSWYTPSAARTDRVRGLIFFRPSATMHTTTYHGHEYKSSRANLKKKKKSLPFSSRSLPRSYFLTSYKDEQYSASRLALFDKTKYRPPTPAISTELL